MLKPIFDTSDQCGQPNPLLTLSKAVGQNDLQHPQGVGALQRLTASSRGASDLFTHEYLANVAQKSPPTTWDMRQMLAQLPANDQRQIGKALMEQGWVEAQTRSKADALAAEWEGSFVKQSEPLAQKWVDAYGQQHGNGQMEELWQTARTNSTLAKDFLERYDHLSVQPSGDQLASNWESEFLNHLNKLGTANGHQSADQEINFFDYESAWEAIHSKEAQERYDFVQENPFVGEQSPVEMARQCLGQGRLADSILHFEAALRSDPSNHEIWYSLGLALAENEQDPRAISALRNALKLSPRHEKSILALAVSLANESFEHLALHELHKWICVHQGREMPEDTSDNTTLFRQYAPLDRIEFSKVERFFLESTRTVQQVDPELQNALSVLYNLGHDYDRAVDCLHAALATKPEDAILWNRLGATLANADRSAEAINAYKRALQLSPAYVRARYNLGTACMNLNSYSEAAAHFVAALQSQYSPDQSQIWSRLRSALIRIDNDELGPAIFDALDKRQLGPIAQFLQGQSRN